MIISTPTVPDTTISQMDKEVIWNPGMGKLGRLEGLGEVDFNFAKNYGTNFLPDKDIQQKIILIAGALLLGLWIWSGKKS